MLSPLRSTFSSPSLSVQSYDPSNCVICPEIAQIFKAAYAGSAQASPSPLCRDRRKITPHLRAKIMSWLNEVSQSFQLQQETLFLALSLFDRFMSLSSQVWQSAGSCSPTCALPLSFVMNPNSTFILVQLHA